MAIGKTHTPNSPKPIEKHSKSAYHKPLLTPQTAWKKRKMLYGFQIAFLAVDRNAILTAHCGRGAKTIGISNLDTCGQIGLGKEILLID